MAHWLCRLASLQEVVTFMVMGKQPLFLLPVILAEAQPSTGMV